MGPEFTGSLAEFQRHAPLAQLISSQTPVDCRHLTPGGWSNPPGPERLQWTKLPLEAKLELSTPWGYVSGSYTGSWPLKNLATRVVF